MAFSKLQLRKTLRRILRESVHSHLDGELTNAVFAAAEDVAEEYGDITVQDVEESIARMSDEYLAGMVEPRLADYFVESTRQMTYEDIVGRMFQLVDMGELSGGYEDFFELPSRR